MLTALLAVPAVWGVLGAFVYAGPKLSTCLFATRDEAHTLVSCFVEFLVALAVGAATSAAFAPWALTLPWIKTVFAPTDIGPMAAMLGLLANPIAPKLIAGVDGKLNKYLKGDKA